MPGAPELTGDGRGCGCSTEPAQSSPEGWAGGSFPQGT